jgi:hypothetical protein
VFSERFPARAQNHPVTALDSRLFRSPDFGLAHAGRALPESKQYRLAKDLLEQAALGAHSSEVVSYLAENLRDFHRQSPGGIDSTPQQKGQTPRTVLESPARGLGGLWVAP